MAHPSDVELLVLLAVRVRSVTSTGDVATAVGVDVDRAQALLERFEGDGLVRRYGGARPGWSLTADGRQDGERRLAAELDGTGTREVVASAYAGFRRLNPELLAACTDWQLRPGPEGPMVNDHLDATHDAAAVARLEGVHREALDVLAPAAAALERYADYAPRLQIALDRVRAGSEDWFDKPMIDSYHTVWFELHEDLLATLGLTRTGEVEEE